jgi:hypothetical protein
MICAVANNDTLAGVYRTSNASNAAPSWSRILTGCAVSVAFETRKWGASHQIAMAGFIRNPAISASSPYGAYCTFDIANLGTYHFNHLTGYYSLPNDVFSSVAHERNSNYVFASSPSMGVFVSTDKGESFRPYNVGAGGTTGPCRLTNGYGITMLQGRKDTNIDAIYVGTEEGIKARYILYDGSKIQLELSDAVGSPSYWVNSHWASGGAATTGYWERLEVVPGTTTTLPVWAVSPYRAGYAGSSQGFADLPAGSYDGWVLQNGGLGSNPSAKGVRTGYDGGDSTAYQLESGQVASGSAPSGMWDYYHIDISADNNDFNVFLDDPDDTQSGGQNCGLYLRYNSIPTASTYDYRAITDGDKNLCVTSILLEGFSASWGTYGNNPPAGWTITTNESPITWDTNNWYNSGSNPRVYSSTTRTNEDETLISPVFNIPAGLTSATLTFTQRFYMPTTGAVIYVKFKSTQNPTWITLYTRNINTSVAPSIDLSSYAGNTNCQIAFEYTDPGTASSGRYWTFDNVQIYGTSPLRLRPGVWYIGVYGVASGNSSYTVAPTIDAGCTQSSFAFESAGFIPPDPKAPVASTTWGTVNAIGVVRGTGSATINFEARNGTTCPLGNLETQTVIQLSDLTLIAGCNPSGGTDCIWYSPAPDEGLTCWLPADLVASEGSKNYVDVLASSNGDVLIAADGTGTGTNSGGVWLCGDKGKHWMRISQGFDSTSQALSDIVADSDGSYYASTDQTGLWTRTVTASAYPSVTNISPNNGDDTGGTPVTITGTGFSNLCPTGVDADCPDTSPAVLFGDIEVAGTYVNSTTITASSPPHAAGPVIVKMRNRDTRESMAGFSFTYNSTCTAPSGFSNNTASDVDACADSGVMINWSDPSNWGDNNTGTRTFDVLRDGGAVASAISSATHTFTDTTGANNQSYSYSVRANNGCAMSSTTSGTNASDVVCVPPEVAQGVFPDIQSWSGNTQSWPGAERATGYYLYRIISSDLPNLQNSSHEGCKRDVGNVISYDCSGDDPTGDAGRVYFYLVTGYNGSGEGSSGSGTGFSRNLTTLTACP